MKNLLRLLPLLLTIILLPFNARASPFLNEIHYDNEGSDTDEGIEIAGPAGTDLNGWSVVLYNGGNAQSYMTISLSGTIADQQNGFGTRAFLQAGIQNGSPDGMVLVNAAAHVVQFLSYGGVFAAADGPAMGMTSTDMGVAENSSTLAGNSLQLVGAGSGYSDFTWSGPDSSSFGAINTGQTFVPIPGAVWLLGSGCFGLLGVRRKIRGRH